MNFILYLNKISKLKISLKILITFLGSVTSAFY